MSLYTDCSVCGEHRKKGPKKGQCSRCYQRLRKEAMSEEQREAQRARARERRDERMQSPEYREARAQNQRAYVARHRDELKEYRKEYYQKQRSTPQGRERLSAMGRESRLRCKYGLTSQQLKQMKTDEGGICPICLQKPKRWAVDHCHVSGEVRGVLCHKCNSALGLMGDTTEALRRALAYLEREV